MPSESGSFHGAGTSQQQQGGMCYYGDENCPQSPTAWSLLCLFIF